jgi:hypothetical protein
MRINVAIPETHVSAPVLDAALEATTRLNESMLKRGDIPSFETAVKHVRWRPEPPGDEHFDHAAEVLGRGWGDCDDLAPYHAASLRHSGKDPQARAVVKKSGPNTWHAVVRRGDGSIDDPSKRAGMGPNIAPGHRGASVPFMQPPAAVVGGVYMMRPTLAATLLDPTNPYSAARARADIPWFWPKGPHDPITPGNIAMATLHSAPVANTALTGAIDGALELALSGGYADQEHIDSVCCVGDCLEGVDYQDLVQTYGEQHANRAVQIVGSFFGGLAHMVTQALPIASKALQFVPGIGPVASTALDIASQHLPHGPAAAHAAQMLSPYAAVQVPHHTHSGRLCVPATFE